MKEHTVHIELEGERFEVDGTEAARITQLRVGPKTPVTLTFRDALAVDKFLRFFSDQDGDDGWAGPEDVKKKVKKLERQWTEYSQAMNEAVSGEAAREWATRMRGIEYAIMELKSLVAL